MTSKELIKEVVHFKNPERIGLSFNYPNFSDMSMIGGLRLDHVKPELSDWGYNKNLAEKIPGFAGQTRMDAFGTIWGRLDKHTFGEPMRGFLQTDQDDWSALDDYVLPRIAADSLQNVNNECEGKAGMYLVGSMPCFTFANMREIRGMQFLLMDMLLHQNEVKRLADMIKSLTKKCIELYAKAGLDAVMFWEDWGTQQGMLISPSCWRSVFKPVYAELAVGAHNHGMDIIMHSCGYIFDILEDLIEVGIDVLQLDQPALMGMERLAERFAGRVTFYSPVDIQAFLPSGDKAVIEGEARRMLKLLGGLGGGLIAMDYGNLEAIGVKDEWAQWARDIFIREGRYLV